MPATVRQHFQGPHTDEDLEDLGLTKMAPGELFRCDPIDGYEPPLDRHGRALPSPSPALTETALGIHVRRNPLAMLLDHPQLSVPWSRYQSAAPFEVDHSTRKEWSAMHLRAWNTIVAAHHRKRDNKPDAGGGDDSDFVTPGGGAL